jgi:hypothetical protein
MRVEKRQFPKWENVTQLYSFWILAGFRLYIHSLTILMARLIKKESHGSRQSPQSHFAVPTIASDGLH